MRVLVVEDEESALAAALRTVARAAPTSSVTSCRSRDTAMSALESNEFDLLVCDLRIPPVDGSLDIGEEYGFAVLEKAREVAPGMPAIMLTGFATLRNTSGRLAAGGTQTFYGKPSRPLVQLSVKDTPEDCELKIRDFADGLAEVLTNCVVDCPTGPLPNMVERAVAAYAHGLTASKAVVTPMGGLSGARVLKVELYCEDLFRASILLKVMKRADAIDEIRRYQDYVPNLLSTGFFAPSLEPILFGLGKSGAVLYTLANPRSVSLFDLLRSDEATACKALETVRRELAPWTNHAHNEDVQIGALRRAKTADHIVAAHGADLGSALLIEDETVSMPFAIVHGDMHGGNILSTLSGSPILIDYGDVGIAHAASDPLILESSVAFHPDSPARESGWPAVSNAEHWDELRLWIEDCPYSRTVELARSWGLELAGPRPYYALAYCHAVRQLKYGDVEPRIAVAMARSAARAFNESHI